MIYTGIGSRETPKDVLVAMLGFAAFMAQEGHTLRSGGAPGADMAFEYGCDTRYGHKEIYLPWLSFNDKEREKVNPKGVVVLNNDEAWNIAAKYHPRWGYLKRGARMLMARNSHQVLGADLKIPTDVIICWTKGGKGGGGTGQALRISVDHEIPIIDFGKYADIADAVIAAEEIVKIIEITR